MPSLYQSGIVHAEQPPSSSGGGGLPVTTNVVTVASPTVDFASIPQNDGSLLIVGQAQCDYTISATAAIYLQFNGDTTNGDYAWLEWYVDQFSTFNYLQASDVGLYVGEAPGDSAGPTSICTFEILIPFYANTDFAKHIHGDFWYRGTANPVHVTIAGDWNQTVAITDISLRIPTGTPANFKPGSKVSLYRFPE